MATLIRRRIAFLGGVGAGIGIMRALERGRSGRPMRPGGARGVFGRAEKDWPDDVVAARVRAAVARAASHPHAIDVSVDQGRVTLTGPVLEREAHGVLRRVGRVAGVRAVHNQLETHASARGVPRLSGPIAEDSAPLERDVWSRSLRVATGAVGAALGGSGLACLRDRHPRTGIALTATGAALLVRAATNRPVSHMLGRGGRRRVVDLRKTVLIRAPVAEVFRFWAQVENFPLFMEHVLDVSVSPTDGRRSHWQVRGPAGMPIRWDAEVTRLVPDEMFAWKTLPGSQLEHAGAVHFEALDPGLTWLQVHMVYVPPAGTVGQFVANVLGTDPEGRVEEDLARLKSLLEDLHTLAPPASAGQRVVGPSGPTTRG